MQLSAGEVMTTDVKTLQESQPLLEAMRFMREHKVRHIPILAGESLVGIVTDRDIKRATPSALAPGQREVWEQVVEKTSLARVMTRQPVTASPQTSLAKLLERFVGEKIGCMPIVEEGRLVGIVTAQDLFKAMLKVLSRSGEFES